MTNEQKRLRSQLKAALDDHRRQHAIYAELVLHAEIAAFFPGDAGGANAERLAMHERMIAEIEAKLAEMAGK